ncbi:MAG: SAM-dependent methyltransferase [Pseudomonadota bacterium]
MRGAFGREPGLSSHIDIDLIEFMQQALMHLHRPPISASGSGNGTADDSPKPSAHDSAILRAAHQLLDQPLILDDPLAVTILGPAREAALRADTRRHRNPIADTLRATMAVRSRLAADSWRQAYADGVRQYVILGAGLDTCAYRADAPADASVFEVDLPATQRWKRDSLRAAGIAAPANLRCVPLDLRDATLAQCLASTGFDPTLPAAFSWLGVSMYLPAHSVLHTLRYMAACAPGSAIVFDFLIAPELLAPAERDGLALMAAGLAEQGEALLSRFDPAALKALLRQAGCRQVTHLGAPALSARYLTGRRDGLRLATVFGTITATV